MANPLMEFARKAELSVRLPSNGNWYEEGDIEYTPNGEVEVYPMLPKDELLLMNPDALLSGQANIQMIKSCVPGIKDPSKLLYPDANVLFLAIQKATYGDELTLEVMCPQCENRLMELRDEEKIAAEEKKGKLMPRKQEASYSISSIMDQTTYLDSEYKVELNNGLTVYVHPTYLITKERYSNLIFNQQKLINMLKDFNYDDTTTDEERKNAVDSMNSCYLKMNEIGNNIITDSISYIKMPDETTINNKEHILEFISNIQSTYVSEIDKTIRKINDIGLPATVKCTCEACGHEFDIAISGFNQSDFFGVGS